jgi:electron-transferring-flavoprotein dehydrogenase
VERESLEVDVLIVGGGPAGLAAAIRLGQWMRAHRRSWEVMLIEKAREVGAHGLSGAVVDPKSLRALMPDHRERGCPVEAEVVEDHFWILTEADALEAPVLPPPLRNHGYYILSVARLARWMAAQAEELGVQVFAGFPGASLIVEDGRVAGVRTADKGLDKHGKPKANYEPGVDIRAKVVVLAEGPRGTLTREAIGRFGLDEGRNPQTYATGCKEVWEFPDGHVRQGMVIHTMGWPLRRDTFGGGFIYGMSPNRLCIGLVIGLDYADPFTDTHHELQRLKTHPRVGALLEGGKMVEYGAKTIPEGGWFAVPRLTAPGLMICGDSGSLLDPMRLKGVHMAIQSGIFAAETAAEALQAGRFGGEDLAPYERKVRESWIGEELRRSRYFKHGFKHGTWFGLAHAGFLQVTGGWSPLRRQQIPGHMRMRTKAQVHGDPEARPQRIPFDDRLTFSKLTSVYHSGTIHEEDSPCHLIVADPNLCAERCTLEFGNPCQYFCPANVYEWVEDGGGPGRLQINFTNCVHCKTCDIMDPYQNIRWVVPEGGGGPGYQHL